MISQLVALWRREGRVDDTFICVGGGGFQFGGDAQELATPLGVASFASQPTQLRCMLTPHLGLEHRTPP